MTKIILKDFDKAVSIELKNVQHIDNYSYKLCRNFAAAIRKSLVEMKSAPTSEAGSLTEASATIKVVVEDKGSIPQPRIKRTHGA